MDSVLASFKQQSERAIEQLKEDLKSIRTGRASPALVENLPVKTYGGQTTLKLTELATITTDGPTALTISPFDPSTVTDIEKAIQSSALGLTPQTQGTTIIVRIPALTQEQREKILKVVGQKIEEKKVQVRNYRDEVRRKIKNNLEAKEITEDGKFRLEKEVDIQTQTYMTTIQEIKQKKEDAIMQI